MHKQDDLLDRIQALEQQLATVLERTAGITELSRPTSAVRTSNGSGRRQAPCPRSSDKSPARKPSSAAATQREDASHATQSGPSRIPGVRIACIGARPDAVGGIRAYWERRGASFEAYGAVETSQHALDHRLGRTDVVFLCVDTVDAASAMRLQAYCSRTEKALIPVHDVDASEFALVIESWYPLA